MLKRQAIHLKTDTPLERKPPAEPSQALAQSPAPPKYPSFLTDSLPETKPRESLSTADLKPGSSLPPASTTTSLAGSSLFPAKPPAPSAEPPKSGLFANPAPPKPADQPAKGLFDKVEAKPEAPQPKATGLFEKTGLFSGGKDEKAPTAAGTGLFQSLDA